MCTKPIDAWQLLPKHWFNPDKAPKPIFRRPADIHRYEKLSLPCTKCISCLKVKAMTLAVQLACELQTTEGPSQFITLTYDPEHLPPGHTLVKEHPQLFLKRLRKHISKEHPGTKITFKLVSEYGEGGRRPHYHLVIFGIPDFEDRKISKKKQPETHKLYESEILTKLWGKGDVIYSPLTYESCLYQAQHSDKKINRQIDYSASLVDLKTGEIIEPPLQSFNVKDKQNRLVKNPDGTQKTEMRYERIHEYVTGSNRPGLGTKWFDQFGLTDLEDGRILSLDNRSHKIPRHIMTLLERDNPVLHEILKLEAKLFAEENQKTQNELDYQDKFDHANLKYKQKRNKL